MAPTSWVYPLSKLELVDELAAREMDTVGSFAELRARLVAHIAALPGSDMLGSRLVQRNPCRVMYVSPADMAPSHSVDAGITREPCAADALLSHTPDAQCSAMGGHNKLAQSVVADLVGKLHVIDGTDHVALCSFLVEATSISDLELLPFRPFILSLLTRFQGELPVRCIRILRQVDTWDLFCHTLLRESCTPFVLEDLLRGQVTRRFQAPGENFDHFVTHIFQSARVLRFEASETALVEICVRNMSQGSKSLLAFASKPTCLVDLRNLARELDTASFVREASVPTLNTPPSFQPVSVESRQSSSPRCWRCGVVGHRRGECPTRSRLGRTVPPPSGNEGRARR